MHWEGNTVPVSQHMGQSRRYGHNFRINEMVPSSCLQRDQPFSLKPNSPHRETTILYSVRYLWIGTALPIF
jgi:hypothetical protein